VAVFAMTIDLNCDMGELEDAQHEAALMESITSANIAVRRPRRRRSHMERTTRLALERGYASRPPRLSRNDAYHNSAASKLPMSAAEIGNRACAQEQIERLDCRGAPSGAGEIVHVKAHGALV